MELIYVIKKYEPCAAAVEWLGDRDFETAWAECKRPDWMLWLVGLKPLKRGSAIWRGVVLSAIEFAESALPYAGDDLAVCESAITIARDCVAHPKKARAAHAYAYAAYAARTAYAAPTAAAYAAYAAYADIIRREIPVDLVAKHLGMEVCMGGAGERHEEAAKQRREVMKEITIRLNNRTMSVYRFGDGEASCLCEVVIQSGNWLVLWGSESERSFISWLDSAVVKPYLVLE